MDLVPRQVEVVQVGLAGQDADVGDQIVLELQPREVRHPGQRRSIGNGVQFEAKRSEAGKIRQHAGAAGVVAAGRESLEIGQAGQYRQVGGGNVADVEGLERAVGREQHDVGDLAIGDGQLNQARHVGDEAQILERVAAQVEPRHVRESAHQRHIGGLVPGEGEPIDVRLVGEGRNISYGILVLIIHPVAADIEVLQPGQVSSESEVWQAIAVQGEIDEVSQGGETGEINQAAIVVEIQILQVRQVVHDRDAVNLVIAQIQIVQVHRVGDKRAVLQAAAVEVQITQLGQPTQGAGISDRIVVEIQTIQIPGAFQAREVGDALATGTKVIEVIKIGEVNRAAGRKAQRRKYLVAQYGINDGHDIHHFEFDEGAGDGVAVICQQHLVETSRIGINAGQIKLGIGCSIYICAVVLPLIVNVGEGGGGGDGEGDVIARGGAGVERLLLDEDGAPAIGIAHIQRSDHRSEEHTSELQSRQYLVCR